MAARDTIIFDLDGTLVDTAPDLVAAVNFVLRSLGRDAVPVADLRATVGLGGWKMIERALTLTGAGLEADDIDALLPPFLEFYSCNIAVASAPFEGVEQTLRGLIDGGAKLGVCTNKPAALSTRLLDEIGLTRYFGAVLGADSVARRKPDPGHLLQTVARLGAEPGQAVMVGDSEADVQCARAANIPVIAVSFGYSTVAPRDLGADAVIDAFSDLPAALDSLAPRAL